MVVNTHTYKCLSCACEAFCYCTIYSYTNINKFVKHTFTNVRASRSIELLYIRCGRIIRSYITAVSSHYSIWSTSASIACLRNLKIPRRAFFEGDKDAAYRRYCLRILYYTYTFEVHADRTTTPQLVLWRSHRKYTHPSIADIMDREAHRKFYNTALFRQVRECDLCVSVG